MPFSLYARVFRFLPKPGMIGAVEIGLAIVANGIQQGKCERRFHRLCRVILDRVLQNGDRKAGVVHVERDERIEGFERNRDGQRGVFEIDCRDGISRGEMRAC